MTSRPQVVADPELVTPEWLTEVFHHAKAICADTRVAAFEMSVIGTGQVGANVRYALTYDGVGEPGPATVVCKFSSRDPQSAAAGVSTRTYETEVAFYRDLAHKVEISRPHCYFAKLEPGTAEVVLVMEDLAPAEQGDQIAGCTREQATLAVDEAARLHGPRWGDPALYELGWLDNTATLEGMAAMFGVVWDAFVQRYHATLDPVALDAGRHLAELVPTLLRDTSTPFTPVHRDYRLDNMLFGTAAGGRPLAVVDWQTVRLGVGPSDVAYFLGSAFRPEIRRSCERDLVARYHRALVEDFGVDDYPFDQCWRDYVRSSYSSLLMAIFASLLVGRTERGDAMFMVMANRSAQMGADLDAPSALRQH
jgi:hypothetical protein